MQKFFFLILLLLSLNISYAQINSPQASPRQTVLQKVGLVDVKIDYSRPSKRDRNIFGDVVPFNEVWRTGLIKQQQYLFQMMLKLILNC